MLSETEIERILKEIEASHPSSARKIKSYIDGIEDDMAKLTSDDAYRAFIIKSFSDFGGAYDLLKRIDGSILSHLAEEAASRAKQDAELAKAERIKLETDRLVINNKKEIFSQPVLLALIAILSSVVTAAVSWIGTFF